MRTLNSAYNSIDGFLLHPGKDMMKVVLAGFHLNSILSLDEEWRNNTHYLAIGS